MHRKLLMVLLVNCKTADPAFSHTEPLTKYFYRYLFRYYWTTINEKACVNGRGAPESRDEIRTYSLPSIHFLQVALADQSLPDLPKTTNKSNKHWNLHLHWCADCARRQYKQSHKTIQKHVLKHFWRDAWNYYRNNWWDKTTWRKV